MKKIFNIATVVLSVLVLNSCETDLTRINENPNDNELASVSPKFLLPTVSKALFQVPTNNLFVQRMMIATDGENVHQYLKWDAGSFGEYSSILLNIDKMMKEAEKTGEQNYIAIAKLYRAIVFYNLTLTFGDIPYTEAVKGEEKITQPKYDSQEEVFIGILKELEEANTIINNSASVEGDIIYNGDMLRWKKFINSFRLKVLMTLSKKGNVGSYNISQEFAKILNNEIIMQSIEDNAQLKFFDSADSRYSTFNDSSYGSSVYMADYFIDLFKDRRDPRLFTFAEQTTGAKELGKSITDFSAYNGGNPTSSYSDNAVLVTEKNISKVNIRFYKDAINEPYNVLSYSELQFILAEASARKWISNSAKTHYENGIKSNFDFYKKYVKNSEAYFSGFNLSDYLASSLVVYKDSETLEQQLEQIMTQKYMTMFHQGQMVSYHDYLRTGYPNFPLPKGMTKAPARYRYPQTEYNYNAQNLKKALQNQFAGNDNIESVTWWLK